MKVKDNKDIKPKDKNKIKENTKSYDEKLFEYIEKELKL